MNAFSLVLAAFSAFLYAGGYIITWRALGRRRFLGKDPNGACAGKYPEVSLLKPLKGPEEALIENLESFYTQTYAGNIEIIFACANEIDPAVVVAREVASRFPHIKTTFVFSDESFGYNPKVSILKGAIDAAHFDLLLQSDANVRLRPTYLRDIVDDFISEQASLLGSIVVGEGETSWGAALENMHLSAFITPAQIMARDLMGITPVIGKAMLFRKSDLDRIGGIGTVKDVLAEDFFMGMRFTEASMKVHLSLTPVHNINVRTPVRRFIRRHARWAQMRAVISLPSMFGDLAFQTTFFFVIAAIANGFSMCSVSALFAFSILRIVGDKMLVKKTRGTPLMWRYACLSPLKDLMLGCVWFYAIVARKVEWRGRRFKLKEKSLLEPY